MVTVEELEEMSDSLNVDDIMTDEKILLSLLKTVWQEEFYDLPLKPFNISLVDISFQEAYDFKLDVKAMVKTMIEAYINEAGLTELYGEE
tara:strand:+ start:50 stop:319 length:270 start_codon:yes stop_codon:yes gene_type:complete